MWPPDCSRSACCVGYACCSSSSTHRQRGAVLTKVSLYAIQLEDYPIEGMRDFKNRVQYAFSSIRVSDHPDPFESGEWLLQKLKTCRRLETHIEAVKESKIRSKKRRFDWLWGKLKKLLKDSREDVNASSVNDSLTQGTKARAKRKAKPGAPFRSAWRSLFLNVNGRGKPSTWLPRRKLAEEEREHPFKEIRTI